MPKMTIRIILKSGAEFPVKCDEFTITKNGLQQFTGYNFKGITENKPLITYTAKRKYASFAGGFGSRTTTATRPIPRLSLLCL